MENTKLEIEAELQRCMDAYERGQYIEPLVDVTQADTEGAENETV